MDRSSISHLWSIEPPTQTISQLQAIDQLFGKITKEKIREKLSALRNDYPQTRSIRGDGNCFYRAVAFLHLKSMQSLQNFHLAFPRIDRINMKTVTDFPGVFDSFYDTQTMKNEFRKGWEYLFGDSAFQTQAEKESYLAKMLNKYWLLDFFIIVYFRCVNYEYVRANMRRLREFSSGNFEVVDKLKLIARYGEDSEGIEIESMTECLNENIKIIFVREDNSSAVQFGNPTNFSKVLLLTPGHYDILYNKNQVLNLKRQYINKIYQRAERAYRDELTPEKNVPEYQVSHPVNKAQTLVGDRIPIYQSPSQPSQKGRAIFSFNTEEKTHAPQYRQIFSNQKQRMTDQRVPSVQKAGQNQTRLVEGVPVRRNTPIEPQKLRVAFEGYGELYRSKSYKEIMQKKNAEPIFMPPIYNPNSGLVTNQQVIASPGEETAKVIRDHPLSYYAANFLIGAIVVMVLYSYFFNGRRSSGAL